MHPPSLSESTLTENKRSIPIHLQDGCKLTAQGVRDARKPAKRKFVLGNRLDETVKHLAIAPAPDGGHRLGAVHHGRIAMVHDSSPLATRPACPRHALKDAFLVGLELAESGVVLNLQPKQVNAGARACSGVVSTLAASLDALISRSHYFETRFQWSAAGEAIDECDVDAERAADPEGFQVRFEGVTDEDGGGAALGCGDGEELHLDLDKGGRGRGQGCFGDA